jgi:carbon-monoxide dehydrogenase medium subunit
LREHGEASLKAPAFRYRRPKRLDEALSLLASEGEGARLLAGGQSLVPALNMRLLEPKLLIDITGLAELRGIAESKGRLRLGALTRHCELSDPRIARLAPLLAAAQPFIAHAAIRNRGTLGGSLAHADPAAELPAGAKGRRRVAAQDFFRGVFETALAPGEILVAVEIPAPAPETRFAFLELSRRQGDYALAGIAASASMSGVRASDPRLVFFGIGTRPVEAPKAAQALSGAGWKDSSAAIEALGREIEPAPDLHAGAAMKRQLAQVLLRRAVAQWASA